MPEKMCPRCSLYIPLNAERCSQCHYDFTIAREEQKPTILPHPDLRKRCLNCLQTMPAEASVCLICGFSQIIALQKEPIETVQPPTIAAFIECSKCKRPLSPEHRFCPACGFDRVIAQSPHYEDLPFTPMPVSFAKRPLTWVGFAIGLLFILFFVIGSNRHYAIVHQPHLNGVLIFPTRQSALAVAQSVIDTTNDSWVNTATASGVFICNNGTRVEILDSEDPVIHMSYVAVTEGPNAGKQGYVASEYLDNP